MNRVACKLFEQDLQRECEPRSEARRRHHGFAGGRIDRGSPTCGTPDERLDVFELYPKIVSKRDGSDEINALGKECGDSAWARRESAANLLTARVKLAQRLQERTAPDGDAVDRTSAARAGGEMLDGQGGRVGRRPTGDGVAMGRNRTVAESEDPRERGARQDAGGRGCDGVVGSRACQAVLAGANPSHASRAPKSRQDKPRSRVALVLSEEERARRRRLVEIQPKVSRLSFPFSPRGKDQESVQHDIEHRSRGGIAFTIGDEAGSSPTADTLRRSPACEAAPRQARNMPPRRAKALTPAHDKDESQQSTPSRGGARSRPYSQFRADLNPLACASYCIRLPVSCLCSVADG